MMELFNLKGRTALVTGSGQGIGRAIILALAENGARVIVNWRRNDAAAKYTTEALDALGADYLCWRYDLASDTLKDDFKDFCTENGVHVDILVHNASVQIRREWSEISAEEFDFQMHVNFRASLQLAQCCVPHMQEQRWGRIVTVGSVQQYRPNLSMAVYAASKSAQMNLVRTLAAKLSSSGITVNNLAPGCIETPRNDEALSDAAYRKKIENVIPAGFIGQPEDLAGAALLLCSDAGRYITGADFVVDGGMSIPC